tara:strand:- start:14116 stop:16107 length:1992 start_codon:yes stop_codon:yes gene_type:complete
MIEYLWKSKYFLLSLILIIFIISLLSFDKLKIFYDTERIIEYTNENQDIIDKALEDQNILLVGLEFRDTIDYNQMNYLSRLSDTIIRHYKISSIRSVFNEKILVNKFTFIPINILKLDNKILFNKSKERILKIGSNYISKEFNKIMFLINTKNLLNDREKQNTLNFIKDKFSNINAKIYITGQMKSEVYMQKKVINELVYFTIISTFLCSLLMYIFYSSIKLVLLNLISIIITLSISFYLSNILYGGIELVMILIPAIVMIITISDFMHLYNIEKFSRNKFYFFSNQIQKIGKPVIITSLTTAIGFLSFAFSDTVPLSRFGIITTLTIIIALFIIFVLYSVSVDLNYIKINQENKIIEKIVHYLSNWNPKYKYAILSIMLILSAQSLYKYKINNYITDEINSKSQLFKEIKFFDNNFGGIKPITIEINNPSMEIEHYEDYFKKLNITTDLITKKSNSKYIFKSRTRDIGAINSLSLFNKIKSNFNDDQISFSGVGYLFDKISNQMTREVINGLIYAILIIGVLFVIFNQFNLYFFPISIIPNIIPIMCTVGFLSFFGFYFSLSNAFILAIVFGLIVDDSIHIINGFTFSRRRGDSKEKSINFCKNHTFKAVIKTSIVIIATVLPLLFSEFKSISQLALITIISAILAIIFDIVYLPSLLKKYI